MRYNDDDLHRYTVKDPAFGRLSAAGPKKIQRFRPGDAGKLTVPTPGSPQRRIRSYVVLSFWISRRLLIPIRILFLALFFTLIKGVLCSCTLRRIR